MNTTLRVVVGAALITGTVAGCSDNNATPRPGVLPPATAVLSIDGKDVGKTYSVRCETIDWMTRIHTGIDSSGVGRTGHRDAGLDHITRAALGFNKATPTRLRAETFAIKVSC